MMREREEKKNSKLSASAPGKRRLRRERWRWRRSGCEPSRPERSALRRLHRRSPSTAFDRVTSEYKGKISPTCNVEKKREPGKKGKSISTAIVAASAVRKGNHRSRTGPQKNRNSPKRNKGQVEH